MQKRLFGVPKLEDANLAGTKEVRMTKEGKLQSYQFVAMKGHSCTLILTEGDSAKA